MRHLVLSIVKPYCGPVFSNPPKIGTFLKSCNIISSPKTFSIHCELRRDWAITQTKPLEFTMFVHHYKKSFFNACLWCPVVLCCSSKPIAHCVKCKQIVMWIYYIDKATVDTNSEPTMYFTWNQVQVSGQFSGGWTHFTSKHFKHWPCCRQLSLFFKLGT